VDGHAELIPGRTYLLKTQSKEVRAPVTAHQVPRGHRQRRHLAARTLQLNDIGVVNSRPRSRWPFEPYATIARWAASCSSTR
jgi:bifunctional enzyme CysN/CysC